MLEHAWAQRSLTVAVAGRFVRLVGRAVGGGLPAFRSRPLRPGHGVLAGMLAAVIAGDCEDWVTAGGFGRFLLLCARVFVDV